MQPIADKIISQMDAWKDSILLMVGILLLAKSTIQSMVTHTIIIYSWRVALLKYIERIAINFIWSVVVNKKKLIIIA